VYLFRTTSLSWTHSARIEQKKLRGLPVPRFFQRKYDGRAANQNWAVENIPFKYPWVYYSDADEGGHDGVKG
jgi:hypothetical protein